MGEVGLFGVVTLMSVFLEKKMENVFASKCIAVKMQSITNLIHVRIKGFFGK